MQKMHRTPKNPRCGVPPTANLSPRVVLAAASAAVGAADVDATTTRP